MAEIKNQSRIQNYFKDKTILVTGATGFVGKLVVEKLLRTCNVKKIYLLLRPKKGNDVYRRFEELCKSDVFVRLRSEKKDSFKNIEAVAAELTRPNFGMNNEDLMVIQEEVEVVFHTAATIRFDETLKVATDTNVKGTEELLKLCAKLQRLSSMVYVSTAYSFCVKPELQEKFYEPPMTSSKLYCLTDALDDKATQNILGLWPNTYVFTKSIAEDCVKRMGNQIPIAMVRPSIIFSTASDPVPGWGDRFTGATRMYVGIAQGYVRTEHLKFDCIADIIPADYVVNCLLAAAENVSQHRKSVGGENIPVYNCVTYRNPISSGKSIQLLIRHANRFPSTKKIWKSFFIACGNKQVFLIMFFFLHSLPAYIADFFALCFGRNTRFVQLNQKFGKLLNLLSYFGVSQWIFDDTNTQALWRGLSKLDQTLYPFDVTRIDWDNYFHSFVMGARKYLHKETDEMISEGRSRYFKLEVAHYVLIIFISLFVLYIFVSLINCIAL
ncbi:hypothetical protein FQA39_LY05517 [Lamprigera yunnana]|nr:hypothetical protein FQA39_LY05517 [Lamprigera yunnana]